MNNHTGELTVTEGTDSIVRLAMIDADGPTEPSPIALAPLPGYRRATNERSTRPNLIRTSKFRLEKVTVCSWQASLNLTHRFPPSIEKLSLCRSVLMRAVVFDKPRRAARVLRALAFTACVPYLALKIAWVSGSHAGIPEGSMLLEHHTAMIVGNSASVLLDSMVVVLALLLTEPSGRRAPVWLLILPVWAATGLLSPIMVGYPLQLGARLLGGTAAPSGGPAARPFLDEWVFTVVYTGFIVQALALGALFVLYARARWGHLWRGRISGLAGQGPTRGVQRATALMASAVVLVPLTAHLLWAARSTSDSPPPRSPNGRVISTHSRRPTSCSR